MKQINNYLDTSGNYYYQGSNEIKFWFGEDKVLTFYPDDIINDGGSNKLEGYDIQIDFANELVEKIHKLSLKKNVRIDYRLSAISI